jgi:hypothetical protein
VRIGTLPPNLYYNPDWMGFAMCAVFSFHKHPSAINLDSGFLHPFKCHVATDLGCVRPFFESSISEAHVGNDQRSIIWVLFVLCERSRISHTLKISGTNVIIVFKEK